MPVLVYVSRFRSPCARRRDVKRVNGRHKHTHTHRVLTKRPHLVSHFDSSTRMFLLFYIYLYIFLCVSFFFREFFNNLSVVFPRCIAYNSCLFLMYAHQFACHCCRCCCRCCCMFCFCVVQRTKHSDGPIRFMKN